MKSVFQIAAISLTVLAANTFGQSALGSTLSAFENKPGYVQPIATTIGTLLNSGWVNSARVGNGIGWHFALSVPVAFIGADDQTYDWTYDSRCASLRTVGVACPDSLDNVTMYNIPTIFGGNSNATFPVYHAALAEDANGNPLFDANGNLITTYSVGPGGTVDDGEKHLRKWVNIPFLIPTTAISYRHTQGTLRTLWAPSVGDFGGMYLIGLGAQHDFTRFLPPRVGEKGFNTSATVNVTRWSIGYDPSGTVQGTMNLKGWASFTGLVAGWRWKSVELFSEIGYETASFASSGSLIDYGVTSLTDSSRYITPSVSVSGRNGFRASFNIAMHLGVWQPVVAYSGGAQLGSLVNIIQFGKEGEE